MKIRIIKKIIFIQICISYSFIQATGAWMWSNRSHGELVWKTISTENFNIHYHEGIYDIAIQGASMAEQVRPVLMQQMGIEELPKLDIAFTTEDEVLNGFATSGNYTIIWVDQNDASLWLGDEKWMRSVLVHELQHLVFFNTVKGPKWLPNTMHSLISGVPPWIVEGLAEYYTEKWRPFRYDISHKGHVIRNTVHKIADPHNDGFSKSLYLADRFGDSTITKILNYRNSAGLLFFENSFKKHTGIKLKQFNEDWRRHMNTFFYGQRAQKERLIDVGRVHKLPMKKVVTFDYFPDSMRIAMIGMLSKGQGDLSLVVATRDTAKEKKIWKERVKIAKKKNEKPKRVKHKWKLKELDYGVFGELIMNLDVSPDNKSIVYPKYRYGKNQSLIYDVWKIDIETNKKTLLTYSMRANYPKFSPDGESILFVAHKNSISQLYTMDTNGKNVKQITKNGMNTQVITPFWSPNGKEVVFSKSGPDGLMDIYIVEIETGESKKITNSSEGDYLPIWHPNGEKISYTGLYEYTPNLFTYDLKTGTTIQNTDVGDVVIGTQWNNTTSTITAMTLNTVDSARVVSVDPKRVANKTTININNGFSSWREKRPDYPIKNIDPDLTVNIIDETNYKFYKNMKHLGSIVLPDVESFLYNGAFTDALGQHTLAMFYGAAWGAESTLHSTYIGYQNSSGFPFRGFWGIDIYKDSNFQLQFLNQEQSFIESFNGFTIWGRSPYNFGKSLSANHSLTYSLQLVNRKIYMQDSRPPETSIFSNLESARTGEDEGSINLKYTFVNKRKHRVNMLSPRQGYGLTAALKYATEELWGNFDYTKIEFDSYTNNKLGPFTLYGRLRYETINGTPPTQDSLGIFNIPNFYLMGSVTPGREYMSPRGYTGSRFGTEAFMGTFEFRLPIVPINIIEAFRVLKLGRPTFALITDFGNAWSNAKETEEIIITTGAEFRFSINLAAAPIFIFSYGWAQEPKEWEADNNPNPYLQLTLINPF